MSRRLATVAFAAVTFALVAAPALAQEAGAGHAATPALRVPSGSP